MYGKLVISINTSSACEHDPDSIFIFTLRGSGSNYCSSLRKAKRIREEALHDYELRHKRIRIESKSQQVSPK